MHTSPVSLDRRVELDVSYEHTTFQTFLFSTAPKISSFHLPLLNGRREVEVKAKKLEEPQLYQDIMQRKVVKKGVLI